MFSKKKAKRFGQKMINHRQAQLQEYKRGYMLQLYFRLEM